MSEKKPAGDKGTGSTLIGYIALAWLVTALIAVIVGIALIAGEQVTDTRLIFAVSLAGAGGAAVQASTALVNFLGSREYRSGWTLYFAFRPLLGAGMAVTIYVLLRSAFLASNAPTSSLNVYGIVALSFLSGVVSSTVLVKLTELYDTVLDRGAGIRNARESRQLEPRSSMSRLKLDRYQGFLVCRVAAGRVAQHLNLEVWLQDKQHEALDSIAVNIGDGPPAPKVTFYINVYPAICDVEPKGGQLVAGFGLEESTHLSFELKCPAGKVDRSAYVELSQKGVTVAVVAVSQKAVIASH